MIDPSTKDKPPVARVLGIDDSIGSAETRKQIRRQSNNSLFWSLVFGVSFGLVLIAIVWYKVPDVNMRTVSCDYFAQYEMQYVPARCVSYFQGK